MATYTDELVTRFTTQGEAGLRGALGSVADSAGAAAGRHQAFTEALVGLAPQISAVGQRISDFSRGNQQAATEAEYVDNQLRHMYQQKGFSAEALESTMALAREMQRMGGINDETTKKTAALMASFKMAPEQINKLLPAIAMQADLTGSSMESVGTAIGKAFGSGQFGMLKRFGVTLGPAESQQLNLAQAMRSSADASERARGEAMAFSIILEALTANTPPLSSRLETVRGKQDRLKYALEDVQEQMGAGVIAAQGYGAMLLTNLVEPLGMGHEAALRFAGGASYVAGGGMKAGGTVLSAIRDFRQYQAIMTLARNSQVGLTAATNAGAAANGMMTLSLGGVAAGLAVVTASAIALYLWYRTIMEMQAWLAARAQAKEAAAEESELRAEMRARGWEFDETGAVTKRGASMKGKVTKRERTTAPPPIVEGRATPTGDIRGQFVIPRGEVPTMQDLADYSNVGE